MRLWNEGRLIEGRTGGAVAPPPSPQTPLPTPFEGPERRAKGPTFRSKSGKGLGEGVWGRGQGSADPWPPPPRTHPTPERIAAVDIGSLTVRLAVAEVAGSGKFQVILHRREITGLGREVGETGLLSRADQDRTLEALGDFARELAAQAVGRGQAVATQAVRQAGNGQEFLEAAAKVFNIPVRLLAPEEEAHLALSGVLSALDPKYLEADPLLVFDVGGGSSEFILVRRGQEPVFAGLPLGVLSLSQARPLGDPPHPDRVIDLKRVLRRGLQDFYQPRFGVLLERPPLLVGTAGAVTTLAAMAQEMTEYDPTRVNNYLLSKHRVDELADRLAALPEKERALLPGIEPAKAEVMVAGVLIIQSILQVFGQDSLVTVDAGLLEGVLAELAG
jgi:exopolyphosphatase/guanosine-5'-triphosphate,3'-diphosphate pyrophosphatase